MLPVRHRKRSEAPAQDHRGLVCSNGRLDQRRRITSDRHGQHKPYPPHADKLFKGSQVDLVATKPLQVIGWHDVNDIVDAQ
ncbi:hypothetical protein D3C75_1281290 [compost metagenome]